MYNILETTCTIYFPCYYIFQVNHKEINTNVLYIFIYMSKCLKYTKNYIKYFFTLPKPKSLLHNK